MKQLTQVEFDALEQGPYDARVVGLPPVRVQVWMPDTYGWETCVPISGWWQMLRIESKEKPLNYPMWHKLPLDIKES